MQRRRSFLKGAAAACIPALAHPAIAETVPTLRFVPEATLATLDPVWTTATVTTNHSYYVYDQLYAIDAGLQPRPQMAEGHEVSPDGRAWTIRLRESLAFHDNIPVRSIDCAASIERWTRRDVFGQLLGKVVEKYETPDDRTLVIRLTRPFPLLLSALAKPDTSGLFIMPERIARTDPFKAITEADRYGTERHCTGRRGDGAARPVFREDGVHQADHRRGSGHFLLPVERPPELTQPPCPAWSTPAARQPK